MSRVDWLHDNGCRVLLKPDLADRLGDAGLGIKFRAGLGKSI
jgi:hypothetical protein